jgi:MoxR-like ATPase
MAQLQRSAIESAERLLVNLEQVVIGKHEQIALVLSALISGGHVLLEDVPGTAKTILARAIACSVGGATFSRIQCTPDLQPTDVTGLSIFDQKTREFEYRAGPVFANVVLVDEVNRAMPRTQSALLEAMAERQVTVDGTSRRLPDPFLVIATENPIEQEGTFPLPEAQLDRFALQAGLGYPQEDEEISIVLAQRHGHPLDALEPVVSVEEVHALQQAVEHVYVDDLVLRWTVELVRATRSVEGVAVGASVRGSLTLERTARAWALLHGRTHVTP